MIRRFDIVLFDLGHTLIYFDGEWPAVLAEADQVLYEELAAAGLRLDREAFIRAFQQRMEQYLRERATEFIQITTQYLLGDVLAGQGCPDVPESVLAPALAAMYRVTQQHWQVEPEARQVLEALQADGYRLGLISNAGDDADVQSLVDQSGLRSYFDVILTSPALGIRKPNPRIFQMALEHWDARPEQAVMVGDTLGADILGARNAGIFSIWITRRAETPGNRDHLDTIQPDAVISNLSELPGLLDQLNHV